MADNDFDKMARSTLQQLAHDIEDNHPEIDVEWHSDVLSLTFDDGRQYIINKHGPTQQIWVSSPLSGGWHFQYNPANRTWVCTKEATLHLHDLLQKELTGK